METLRQEQFRTYQDNPAEQIRAGSQEQSNRDAGMAHSHRIAVADGHSDRSQPRPRAGRQEVGKSRPRGCVARARARCRLVRKLNQTHVSTLGLFASLPFGLCILVYTIPTNILGVGPPGLKGPVRPLLLHPPGPGLSVVAINRKQYLFFQFHTFYSHSWYYN